MSRFAFVAAERANHAVATPCRIIGASVSGFHAWLRAIPATRARAEAEADPPVVAPAPARPAAQPGVEAAHRDADDPV